MSNKLQDAIIELDNAREAHDSARAEAKQASSREISARNRLNDAQKAFDAAVAEIKKDAPWDSNWHSQKNRGEPCT